MAGTSSGGLIGDIISAFESDSQNDKNNAIITEGNDVRRQQLNSALANSDTIQSYLRQFKGLSGDANNRANTLDALMQQIVGQSQAPMTDARGNSVEYDPATHTWKTKVSGKDQTLQNAADKESLLRETADQDYRRRSLADNDAMRQDERSSAKGALDRYNAPEGSNSLESLTGLLTQRALSGLNRGYDDAQDRVTTQGVRSGTSVAPQLAEMASRRAEDFSKSSLDAAIAAIGTHDQLKNSNNQRNIGDYLQLANSSKGIDDGSFAPTNTLDKITQLLAQRSQGVAGSTMAATGVGNLAANTRNFPYQLQSSGLNALNGSTMAINGVVPVNQATQVSHLGSDLAATGYNAAMSASSMMGGGGGGGGGSGAGMLMGLI